MHTVHNMDFKVCNCKYISKFKCKKQVDIEDKIMQVQMAMDVLPMVQVTSLAKNGRNNKYKALRINASNGQKVKNNKLPLNPKLTQNLDNLLKTLGNLGGVILPALFTI